MGLTQFCNSISQIRGAGHVRASRAMVRHLIWQFRKLVNAFPVVLRLSQSRLYVDRPSGVAALVNSLGMYDYNNMNLIKLLLNRTGTVLFDVGANIGSYTIVASETPGVVVCFEPHPAAFASLRRNIEFNGRNNIMAINAAASDGQKQLQLTDNAQLAVNRVVKGAGKRANIITVQATTLDQTCRELSLRPSIVKIDVEGHEENVLDGFVEGIATVEVILIEGGERQSVRRHPALEAFAGPYYFHYGSLVFSCHHQGRTEDPIFVRRSSIEKLKTMGVGFVGIQG